MKPYIKWLLLPIIILLLILVPTLKNTINKPEVQAIFDAEELAFIEAHPSIKIGLDPSYAPFEFFEDNAFKGMSLEFLAWFEEYTGLKIETVKYETFSDILTAVKNKEIDMTGGVIKTEERQKFMTFTDTFYANFDIILIRQDSEVITEKDLVRVKTGAIRDYSVAGYLKDKYPTIDLVEVSDISEGLQKLAFGEIDAFVTDFSQASYYIYKYGHHNITAIEDAKISIDGNLRFGIRKDYEVLAGIINKALQNLPTEKRTEIQQRWIGLNVKPLFSKEVIFILIIILSFLSLIVAFVLVLNRVLKKEVASKTIQLENELARVKSVEKNLQNLNETLEIQVKNRTLELEKVIEDLERTQKQVIKAEKMAFLGNLVAGVAHEMNSPLGVVLTGSSHLKVVTEEIKSALGEGRITKAKMEQMLETLENLSLMIEDNTTRMSKLVLNFKQLAVEQYQNKYELFSPYEICQSVLHHFSTYTKDLVKIENKIPKSLLLYSSSNAFEQIIEQLIQNALQHSEIPLLSLAIAIEAEVVNEEVIFHVRDNGKGMDKGASSKAFDPFFTTKRHIGNAGLGMHIVYNLVKYQLEGEVEIQTEPESGFEVIIRGIKPKVD